jgi:hypothetical protein
MFYEPIVNGLYRHTQQVLSDLHLLLQRDVASFDVQYYNDIFTIITDFSEDLKQAEKRHRKRIEQRKEKYENT